MENFKFLTQKELLNITNIREGEVKFGEKMITKPIEEDFENFIINCSSHYILFGIPEDIGVQANKGTPGSAKAWDQTLKSMANLQHNKFCKGNDIVALGHIEFDELTSASKKLNSNIEIQRKELFQLVEIIDKTVSYFIYTIIKNNKIPIIIGGGHNNAYGNIKGTALAHGKAINAINFDAHSDFRVLEGRHSGNGFSYAFEEGFLNKYFIFGLHESYTSKNVLHKIKELQNNIKFNTYEEVAIREEKSFFQEVNQSYLFIKNDPYGIEIDLDAIQNTASSAMTPGGYSLEETRKFVHFFAKHKNAAYIHICEGVPELSFQPNLIGKLICYLITDFVKSKNLVIN
jgi:formiminoglutamase